MIHLPKNETKLMVAVHGWSGILLGLVLYAVVLTGTAAVFAEEIGIWSSGHMSSTSAFERPVGQNVQALGSQTPTKYHEGVDLFEVGDHDLGAFFHRHEIDPDGELVSRGIFYRVNSNGQVIDRQAGTSEEVFGPRNDDALSHFLVDTHVRLHLPNPWGLLLTGILGLAMLVAAVSGLMIHRHLFKDIFTLRRKANPVLFNRDRHSVAGTWSLPFAFILAFTGSFFSFFGTVGVPIVAMAAFGGDVQALNSSVFGNPGQADPRPAPTSGIDRITRDAIQRTGEIPTFVTIENFGRADAKVTTFHPPEKGGVLPISLLYDGADGRFEQVKPLIGTKPSAGGALAGIMSPLHFGNFAGILSKAVWFGLGFAMCYVTLTGLRLWVVRRVNETRSLGWLDRMVTIVGLGLPFALLCTAVAFLCTTSSGSALFWTPAGFLMASALVIIGGAFIRDRIKLSILLECGMGILMLILPSLRLFMGGPGWVIAMKAGQPIIAAVDIALLIAGLWMLARHFPQRAPRSGELTLQAAE
jgi:uncharacterized iron-regulated membrane protein